MAIRSALRIATGDSSWSRTPIWVHAGGHPAADRTIARGEARVVYGSRFCAAAPDACRELRLQSLLRAANLSTAPESRTRHLYKAFVGRYPVARTAALRVLPRGYGRVRLRASDRGGVPVSYESAHGGRRQEDRWWDASMLSGPVQVPPGSA